jgi:hypothetical protein
MSFVSVLQKTSFPSSGQWQNGQGKEQLRKVGERRDNGYNPNQFMGQRNPKQGEAGHSYNILCQWEPFREEILRQWSLLTAREVDEAGPNRSKLAHLIQNKYGIAAYLVENYFKNFERTLPLL